MQEKSHRFLQLKTSRQCTSVPREWSNWTECSLQFQPKKIKIQQRKGSHCRNNSQQKKRAEGAADGMQQTGMPPPKQQQKKVVSANQKDKQVSEKRSSQKILCLTKEAGWRIGICNATLEQLGYKVKEEKIIMASAKAAGNEAGTWAATHVLNKNQRFPRVLRAIRYPSLSKLLLLSKCNSKGISSLNLKSVSVLLPSWNPGTVGGELRNRWVSTSEYQQGTGCRQGTRC